MCNMYVTCTEDCAFRGKVMYTYICTDEYMYTQIIISIICTERNVYRGKWSDIQIYIQGVLQVYTEYICVMFTESYIYRSKVMYTYTCTDEHMYTQSIMYVVYIYVYVQINTCIHGILYTLCMHVRTENYSRDV